MTNTAMLQKRIDDSGLKRSFILQEMGIKAYSTLRGKVENKYDFSASEIQKLCSLLRIDNTERDAIFFAKDAE